MATLRQIIEGILKNRIANPERVLATQLVAEESGDWTATIRGSGTAGTYEIASQNCRYTRIGRRVWVDIWIELAGTVTGGGTGYAQITGVPFSKIINTLPQGAILLNGVVYTAGASLTMSFISNDESSALYINETTSGASIVAMAISGLGASDQIKGSICYETDDA